MTSRCMTKTRDESGDVPLPEPCWDDGGEAEGGHEALGGERGDSIVRGAPGTGENTPEGTDEHVFQLRSRESSHCELTDWTGKGSFIFELPSRDSLRRSPSA